ncbi:DUF4391 domain-containing protein [Pseudomonas aeruginosa]|nr:DUF4391 domain-containing protein [Pseudomonas aeruginosa]
MTQPKVSLFAFPGQARVGRPVPKAKIYEHGQIGSALRDKFVAQVEQITWAYKLAPETLNLPARPEVPEIQIFDIELKGAELDDEVLRAIDRAIPLPIIYQLHRDQEICMVAAYKRPSQAEIGKWMLNEHLAGPWLPDSTERHSLPVALDLQGLYEQLLRSLSPLAARPNERLLEHLERLAQLRGRQGEYKKLEARLHKEKQFNRKVMLNAQLRELKNEIDQLGA